MKQDKTEYYGIFLNDDIPKLDKTNQYRKEVCVKFEGKAYLLERSDEDEIIERIEIETEHVLKKEQDYEIEFINLNNETYYLQIKIKFSFCILWLFFFLIGIILLLILSRPINAETSPLARFFDYINLSILELDIDALPKQEILEEQSTKQLAIKNNIKKQTRLNSIDTEQLLKEEQKVEQYEFDVSLKNISSGEIHLTDTISEESLLKDKIAPRSKRKFFDFNEY